MLDCLNGELCSGETGCLIEDYGPTIDWVVAGGESGPDARPSHPDWFRSLRDQCSTAGVPFHFKQWGEYGAGDIDMTTGQLVFPQFSSFQRWVNKASTWVCKDDVCMDASGKVCKIGSDLKRLSIP